MNNMYQLFNSFMNNPMGMLQRRYNIPSNIDTNNPNAIIQHLLDSGQISQAQINQVMQMRNSPMMQMFTGGKR